tara:strand:+ start:1423 stop:1857 length:435 start_codon:yes stop_codon:yes gene_type:complete
MFLQLLTFSAIFTAMTPFIAKGKLSRFQNKNRLLVVFTPDDIDPQFLIQLQDYKHHAIGAIERDICKVDITAMTQEIIVDGRKEAISYTDSLNRLDILSNRFQVILVGKDGDVKKRWYTPVAMDEVFNEIDAMPMRQREKRMVS